MSVDPRAICAGCDHASHSPGDCAFFFASKFKSTGKPLPPIKCMCDRGLSDVVTVEDEMDIHTWFNLTYANYLVLPRTLLQSMPEEWQHKFVRLLNELNTAFDHIERADVYRVNAVDPSSGRFVKDPVPHYNRGREYIQPNTEKANND